MHPHRSALLDLQQATKSLSELSLPQQILTLKLELFHALNRASDLHDRNIELQTSVAELEALLSKNDGIEDAFARELHADLVARTLELSTVRAEHSRELSKLRLERSAMRTELDALDSLCHSLILTIENAIDSDADASGPADANEEPRVSAS
jgi:hypothetical protein